MRTRPVFESYSEFISSLHALNEAAKGIDFDTMVSSLGASLDDNAQKAFEAVRNIVRKSPAATHSGDALNPIKEALERAKNKFIGAVDANDTSKVQISDVVTCDVKEIKFTNVVNGKVIMGSDAPGISFGGTQGADSAFFNTQKGFKKASFKKGNWVDIYDYFTIWNTAALNQLGTGWGQRPLLDDKNRWSGSKDNGYKIGESGLKTSVLSAITPSIQFTSRDNAGKALLSSDYLSTPNGGQTWADEKIYRTYVLYGLEDMIPIAKDGQNIPTTVIKPEFVTVPGAAKDFTIPIAGTDAMFQQGKSELNADNKTKTEQAIAAAIGQASSINSIKIVGGASFEGGLELNKQLVVGRANAVRKILIDTFGIAADKITVDDKDFSQIQPKDEPAKYPTFRKVYLTINGTQQGDSAVKEVNVSSDETLKAGSVVIKQYALRVEFSSPDRVAPKK